MPLNCLTFIPWKSIERVVARQLGIFVLKTKLFSNLHFRAVPGRSAVDATATLTHDVKKAMEEKNVVSALAFDIKEAFDNVSRNRLIKRLLDQDLAFVNPMNQLFSSPTHNSYSVGRQDRKPANARNRSFTRLAGVSHFIYAFYSFTIQGFEWRK